MSDYDYANARLRALKSALFDARTYAELTQLHRLDDLIARLARTSYAREVEAALARYVGPRVVMEACRVHLAYTYRHIQSFFAEDGARLAAILLARWDLFNVKAIVRGQAAHAAPEAILETLTPAGRLDEAALRTLVRQGDAMATLDLLRMWDPGWGQAARAARASFETTRDWSTVEAALDWAFYAQLLAKLRPGAANDELVRELLAREIDAANALAALRLRGTAAATSRDVRGRFLPGGTLPLSWLGGLANAERDEEALAALRGSRFGPALARADKLSVGAIEDLLDRDLARFGVSFFNRDPLTIATAIGYVTAKRVEAANLRLIAQGLALEIAPAEIAQALIVVG